MLRSLRQKYLKPYIYLRSAVDQMVSSTPFSEVNDRVYKPEWIRGGSDCIFLRNDRRDKREYFTVRSSEYLRPEYTVGIVPESNDDQSVVVDPPTSFTTIEFNIIDPNQSGSLQAIAKATYLDGTQSSQSLSIIGDNEFNNTETIPISFSFDNPVDLVEIEIITMENDQSTAIQPLFSKIGTTTWKRDQRPWISMPVPRGPDGVPIFLISVDSFRYDALDVFDPLLDVLGDDAVIPSEPRTQGHWTRPSHASLFTGTHPATHGYVGTASEDAGQYGIHPDLTTLPELLAENQYKCSASVVYKRTGVEYGFGRGMHRYKYHPMSWGDRDDDASDIISTIIKWIDNDLQQDSNRVFYFAHLFDPHYPYIPPTSYYDETELDFNAPNKYNSVIETTDYLEILREDPYTLEDSIVNKLKDYYYSSSHYVATQLSRLVNHLKNIGIYDESLLIITGDHGEDFLERKFALHNSLTDINIRPGMVIKPPKDNLSSIPDDVNLIDIFPTIAKLVTDEIPEQGAGSAWQNPSQQPRITERIRPDWYNISVQQNDVKAIYTYPENFPERPTHTQLKEGPIEAEFFDMTYRNDTGLPEETTPTSETQESLEQIARDFILHEEGQGTRMEEQVTVSSETLDRLDRLGYK